MLESKKYTRNIAIDLLLTVFTFGLYNIYVQWRQIQAVNRMLKTEKYDFLKWCFLTLITFGLYHIYHEYRFSEDIEICLNRPYGMTPLVSLILTLFGLSFVADAIQQVQINRYYGNDEL